MPDMSDLELLSALGVEAKSEKKKAFTPREERIISGFEDVERFVQENDYEPQHGEDKDIFERLYAVRLDKIRGLEECHNVLNGRDKHELLSGTPVVQETPGEELDDEALLSELGVKDSSTDDITNLTYVRPRSEVRAAEEIAQRQFCQDFSKFKPLFEKVAEDIKLGIRTTCKIRKDAGFLKTEVSVGDFFILNGQTLYIAEMGETTIGSNDTIDARLRVIYSNQTESNLLLDSLRRAIYKDESSRLVSDPTAGPLFSDDLDEEDIESGTIYVLRSKSNHSFIKEHQKVIHKIGVTGGDIKQRISNAKNDPTFLMDDVEIVATYRLSNINRRKLEELIHKFFESAKLNVEIQDRFGQPVVPREWFLVPIKLIDEAVEKIKDGSIVNYSYDPQLGRIK